VDREIVTRAQGGDHAAFAALAGATLGRLNGAARLILRDPELAKDAVQETLLRAWRDLPRLRDPERFEPWLHRLLLNACVDEARRGRRWKLNVELREVTDRGLGDPMRDAADRDQLERGFRRLAPDQRAILVLHYYLGASVPEIATTLSVPLGTAKSRLHRAVDALRSALGAEPAVAMPTANGIFRP
jgi:RNA polymerase sigma-70 factor, ECF subfamily